MNDKPLIPSSKPTAQTPNSVQWVMVFTLIMKVGKEEVKKVFKVNKKRLVIGSALSSDIRIQQNSVSNVHAVVEMEDNGSATIFDMASETGLFVNDQKVVSQELKDGDEVKIGFAMLAFHKVAVNDAQKESGADRVRSTGSGRKLFLDAKEDFRPLILEDERNIIQIFDYPSAGEQCLQVVMYWGNVILDVVHVLNNDKVTLGEDRKSTFLVPGLATPLDLVTFEGNSATLEFSNDMTGVVRNASKMVPLEELESRRFQLRQKDMAKIQFREITFWLSYSPVPPHLKRQRVLERDPLYMQIFFTSMGLTLALLAIIATVTIDKPLDTEELPPRVATVIFKPIPPPPPEKIPPPPKVEKEPEPVKPPPEPPKPKPVPVKTKPTVTPPKAPPTPKPAVKPPTPTPTPAPPKPVQVKTPPKPTPAPPKVAGGNQGEGAKAAGAEGQKGAPNKPKNALHQNDSRGNPNRNTPTKSQVQGPGNVEAMFSDLGGNISKSMAAGSAGAHAAGANLRGYGSQTTEGNGGLGQIGEGKGGGGSSNNSQGLGKSGLGEGLTGKGLGAIGKGGNLAGSGNGAAGVNVDVGSAAETIVMGGLDKSVIDEYIRRHRLELKECYVRELTSAKNLAGKVATRFVISGTGRVTQAGVTSSSIGNSKVENCVLGVLRRIVFPEPLGGGVVEVDYPFSFTPSTGG